MLASIVYDL